MANGYIKEFAEAGLGSHGNVQLGEEPAITSQTVTFTTSTQSATLNAGTTIVMVRTDTAGYIQFGTNPTASSSTEPIGANETVWRSVAPNSGLKIAFST